MPVVLQNTQGLFRSDRANDLWQEVVKLIGHYDDEVAVKFVSEAESQQLNSQYRGKNIPTNVLTFSYDNKTHDVALCLSVARREAQQRHEQLSDYLALLLVHAFLHAVGLDHEANEQQAEKMREAEQTCLERAGFKLIKI